MNIYCLSASFILRLMRRLRFRGNIQGLDHTTSAQRGGYLIRSQTQICSSPSGSGWAAGQPSRFPSKLMVQTQPRSPLGAPHPLLLPPISGHLSGSEPLPGTPASPGPFEGLLLPGGLPPPSYPAREGSPGPHPAQKAAPWITGFPAEDPVTGKRKCCSHLPLQVLPLGLKGEKLLSKEVAPTHSERSWTDVTSHGSFGAKDPWDRTPGTQP